MRLYEVERRQRRHKPTHRKTTATVDEHDVLVPDSVAAQELGGISRMTVHRWDRDPHMIALGWPPRVMLNARGYRSRQALEKFKAALMRKAIATRDAGA